MWTALRSFDEQALTFASRAVLIYIVYIIIVNIVRSVRGKKRLEPWRMIVSIALFGVLCVYLSYLFSLTLSGREAGSRSSKINLEVFGTWKPGGGISTHALENVFLFIPFGILIPVSFRFFRKWWNLVLGAFILSISIELIQLITARGFFEIDDMLLNTAGAFAGYLIFWAVYHSYIGFKHESRIPLSRHEQRVNGVTLFIIQLLPVALLIIMILGLGNDNAQKSSELSEFVTEKLLYIVNKVFDLKWTAEKIEKSVPLYEGAVRKAAHITEYALLTFFGFVFLYCRRIKGRLVFAVTFLFCMAIAVTDEIHQRFVDGRSGTFRDVLIDSLGMLIVLLIIYFILKAIKLKHHKPELSVSAYDR